MVGVKKFQPTDVLAGALKVFWHKGYERTSVPDLEAATGLGRGSLYNAYGDKEGLFLAVMDHYADTIGNEAMAPLANSDPKIAIRGMLEAIGARMKEEIHPPGCLNTNTCIECPGAPPSVQDRISSRFAQLETVMYDLLLKAQQDGHLNRLADPRALARYFIAISQGLAVMNRLNTDADTLDDVINQSMNAWPEPE